MGKVTGFLEIDRQEQRYQPASDRVRHFREFVLPLPDGEVTRQAARCMDCGIPYCHGPTGCPVHNQIPDWNELVYQDDWEEASRNLHSTNNFPEWTGRLCPAPCEEACTLNIENVPVTIKNIEQAIADKAFAMGWVAPQRPDAITGKTVAVVGAGPTGLAAAQQLARAGHDVHVYEREPKAGGLLRYGIPDFKMEKRHVDRRTAQMEAEGVTFHYGENIGVDRGCRDLTASHDAVLLAIGAERPRESGIGGEGLSGVHHAMTYLVQSNRRLGGEPVPGRGAAEDIWAGRKYVVVIGGGDTASDCVGTAFRQGAISVTQLDIRPQPPVHENKGLIWPYWPTKMRTSSSQAEGAEREFQVATLGFVEERGRLAGLRCARVDDKRRPEPGSEFVLKADLAFVAIGFAGPAEAGLLAELGDALARDRRTNIAANDQDYRTSLDKVFAAGDVRRGQSLVVWAIREGRQAARAIDEYLMGSSLLPR